MGHKAGIGAIFGIVTEEGVVKPDSPVVLLDRSNKKIVRRQNTDVNGGFTFNGLNEQEATYMVFATDEDGEEPKNALIQDRILPVPAYSGATFWGNWPFLAVRDGALDGWFGNYGLDVGDQLYPESFMAAQRIGPRAAAAHYGVGTTGLAAVDPPVGAPQIPIFELQDRTMQFQGPIMDVEPQRAGEYVVREHSYEQILDLSSLTEEIVLGFALGRAFVTMGSGWYMWYNANNTNNSNTAFYSQLIYTPSTRALSVRYRVASGDEGATFSSWNGGIHAGTLYTKTHTFAEGAVPVGLSHVLYSLDPGVVLNLFVNGVKVATWDLTSEGGFLPLVTGNNNYAMHFRQGIAFTGASSSRINNPVPYGLFGPCAFYPDVALSDAQAVEHYEALMLTTKLPLLSGYVKEVFMDAPFLYTRLDDLAADVAAGDYYQKEFMFQSLPSLKTGRWFLQQPPHLITLEQSSPVLGGMSTLFEGGYLRARSVFKGFANAMGFSASFFIQPAETPNSQEIVVSLRNDTTVVFQVEVDDLRRLTISVRDFNGTLDVCSFPDVLTSTEATHVVVVVDKAAATPEVRLYLNGTYAGAVSITAASLYAAQAVSATNASSPPEILAFCYIAGTTTGVTTFKGKLCEVAFYNKALPASRVLAHYNARLIP